MIKAINGIINLLIIFSLGICFFVLVTGGETFEVYSLSISITNFERYLRLIVVLLFLKHLIAEKEGMLSKLLKKNLDLIRNLFAFKKNHGDESSGEKTSLLITIFFCVIAGIVLLTADSIKYSGDSCYNFILSSSLPQSYYSRLLFIISSVFVYGLGGLISGYILQLTSSSLMNTRFKTYLTKRLLLLQFDLILLLMIFLILSPFSGLGLLDSYLPVYSRRETVDIFLSGLASFVLAFIVPGLTLSRQYSKTIALTLLTLLIPAYYSYGEYKQSNNIPETKSSGNPSVVLISMDTTRADHLSMYGYKRDTTPNLSIIAKEGIVFTNAYVQMTTTEPSHTSILTGVYPRTHGLLTNGWSISNPKIPHLAEWFKKRGYITAAITSRSLLNPEEMKLKGFDYINVPNNFYESVTADITYKRALKWIDGYGDNPFFLFVHFFDPHREYEPPAPFNSKFNDGYKGQLRKKKRPQGHKDVNFIDPKDRYSSKEIDYMISLYDGEIAYTDEYVFKLIRYIEEKISKSNGNPLFIITSDHGETLGEIQERFDFAFDHGELARYGQAHTPLIFKWKGVIPQGKIIDAIVESVDITPTIVELLSRRDTYKCDGKSFTKLIFNNNEKGKEVAYVQRRAFENPSLNFLNYPEYAVVTEKWFLISNELRGVELYDISNDPLEQNDISKEQKDVVAVLLAKLESWKKEFPSTSYKPQKISKEKIKVLKSLGYTQ